MTIYRHTKILATLGPATANKDAITALIKAGANIFRLNFSHGDHETHRKTCDLIRSIDSRIGTLADLQGPKLRIGTFDGGSITLEQGQSFTFDSNESAGDNSRVYLPHPEILRALDKDHTIFLDDGKVRARVTGKSDGAIETTIEAGSALSDRKGFNLPDLVVPLAALTDKDKTDLAYALDLGVDWIAQSFVQTADDVREAQDLIKGRAKLMAKIEKPSALDRIVEITELADGIMLARGDLGVEIPPEKVPAVQKRIIRTVRHAGKPIVVATQMLESMIESARPTRAEASDVATAVYDGADAVMLSAETATGAYPVRAVEMMDRICRETEQDDFYQQMMEDRHPDSMHDQSDAITMAADYVADDIDAAFIVTYTMSGSTALRMARQRAEAPILCLTPDETVVRQLSVSYGVHAHYAPETIAEDFAGPARHAAKIAKDVGLGQKGDHFVMTAGIPFATRGSTNMLRIAEIED